MDPVHILWRLHLPIIATAVLMTVLSLHAVFSGKMPSDFSLKTLAGSDDPKFLELEQFMREFTSGEVLLLAVETKGVLRPDSIEALNQLVDRAESQPAVRSVASLTKIPPFFRPLVVGSPLAKGLLVSDDGLTAAVLLQMVDDDQALDATGAKVPRSETIATLRQLVSHVEQEYPDTRVLMTGPYLLTYEMAGIVRQDLRQFGTLGALIALVPLLLSLGSIRLAIYPLAVGVATVSLTLGLSIWWQVNTALNLPMLVLLTMVLAVATCIHLAIGGRDQQGHEVIPTVRRMLRPCVGIVATTIAGFAAVGVSDMEPIRSFAILMSSGLAIGLVLSLAVAFIAVRRPRRRAVMARPIELLLQTSLTAIGRRSRLFVFGFALLGLAGLGLAGQLQFSLRFLDNFRPSDPLRTDYELVEQKLTPMQTIELLLTSSQPDQPALTPEVLQEMQQFATEFQQEEAISRSLSLVDVFGFAGAPLPATQQDLDMRLGIFESTLRAALGDDPLSLVLSKDRQTLRMSFIAYEGPSAVEKLELTTRMEERARQLFADDYNVTLTGLYYFYSHVAGQLLRDQITSLVVSGLVIYLILVATLKSWWLGTIGILPTLIATCSCVGLMVLADVPFNMVTSMMLAIALGIAVDNTIHYLWQYRAERIAGADVTTAIRQTHLKVGWACLLSSTVVALGFAVMSWSRFLPIAYFGGITSAVMAIALAANLLFLPSLLLCLERPTTTASEP